MVRKKILSSKDFMKSYEAIYEEGPKVKYKNPDSWIRAQENSNRKNH